MRAFLCFAAVVAESGSHASPVAAARRRSDVSASDARSRDAADGSGASVQSSASHSYTYCSSSSSSAGVYRARWRFYLCDPLKQLLLGEL